mmetsp:Transcript_60149/g.105349  ORF Transcript_60149/g.105349 Transcript_60149/m.105349 type:complete len:319 (-) Transcript_60149:42-998(-)
MTASELVAASKMLCATEPEQAVGKALDAITLYKKAKDKVGESQALDAAVAAYLALPDTYEAIMLAKASLRTKKALGDTLGEGNVGLQLAEMQFAMKNNDDALKYAENAMEKFVQAKDATGRANCNEVMSSIYCAMGEPDNAPNRSEGLRLLNQMKGAIESNDAPKFHKTMDALKTMGAVTPSDIEGALGDALESNYQGAAKFLKDNMDLDELLPKTNGIYVPQRYHYFGFRAFGGLGYGPSFRYTQCLFTKPQKDKSAPTGSWVSGAITVTDDRESWEHELAYNHGVLDGLIQTSFSAGLVGPNGERGFTAMNQYKAA